MEEEIPIVLKNYVKNLFLYKKLSQLKIFIENIYACGPLAYCEASGVGILEESQKN